jgi:hypothetical protein
MVWKPKVAFKKDGKRGDKMIFKDYTDTGLVYHLVTISDLKNVMENGLKYNYKTTYQNKYYTFHRFFDHKKGSHIPSWVVRLMRSLAV